MSKKNKSVATSDELKTNRYPIAMPEVNNMDEVGYYPDDLLTDKISRLESERSRLLDAKFDPRPWEVELAYLHREKDLRNVRLEKHEAYMRDLYLRGEEDSAQRTAYGPITSRTVDPKTLN